MSDMSRREFLQMLSVAGAGGFALDSAASSANTANSVSKMYDLSRFGNVHFLHMTDCHAQLIPTYFREPNVNIGLNAAAGKAPH